MRAGPIRLALTILAAGAALIATARAQSTGTACSAGMYGLMAYGPGSSVGKIAFSATARTTFEQTLGNGSYVHGFMVTHQARDGSGRTRTEMAQNCQRDENGQLGPEIVV